jgi:hypothetical protein
VSLDCTHLLLQLTGMKKVQSLQNLKMIACLSVSIKSIKRPS